MLGLLVAPAPRPEFEALGSNFLEDKVSRNVSPFLVRGAVRAVPGLDTWWAPLHRLRQLCRVDLFGPTTSQRREPEAE